MSKFSIKKIIISKSDFYIDVIYRDIINLKNASKKILEQALNDMYDLNKSYPYRCEQILSYFSGIEPIKIFLKNNCYPIPSYDCSFMDTKYGMLICDDYYNIWMNIFDIIAIRDHNREYAVMNEYKDETTWQYMLSKHNKGFIKYCDRFSRIGTLSYNIDVSSFPEVILLYDTNIIKYLDDHKFNFNIPVEFKYSIRLKDLENSSISNMFENIL